MLRRTHLLPRWIELLGLMGLALALVLLGGCPTEEDDDDTGDDDSAADDDDTGDDDTGDDDTIGDDDTAWTSILGSDDAQGDNNGYAVDIKDYQYQWDGEVLTLRTTSWQAFDDGDASLMVDMYLSNGTDIYTLTYDNVYPSPDSLQMWSNVNGWGAALTNPDSLFFDEAGGGSIILGIDLADLGFDTLCSLEGAAMVNLYGAAGYDDIAPETAGDGTYSVFDFQEIAAVEIVEVVFDDSVVGNGDGVADADEVIDVTVSLTNVGCIGTGANLTGALSLSTLSSGMATIDSDTVTFNGGSALDVAGVAAGDAAFQVTVDSGATAGQILMFDVDVTDDDGNAWGLTTPTLAVTMNSLLSDASDMPAGFDIQEVYTASADGNLTVMVTGFGTHNADGEVDFFLDTNLDMVSDFVLSTYDMVSGTYVGGAYAWDADLEQWSQLGTLGAFEFTAGTGHVSWTLPLAELGDPLLAYSYALSMSGYDYDYVPDDPSVVADMGLLVLADVPYIRLDDVTYSEQSGDGDAFPDPGEVWRAELTISNIGTQPSAVTTGVLTSPDPLITVNGGDVSFGVVAPGASAVAGSQPMLVIDDDADENGVYTLMLTVDADGWPYTMETSVALGLQAADTTAGAPVIDESTTLIGDTSGLADDYQDPSACTTFSASGLDGVYAVNLLTGQQLTADLAYEEGGPDAVIYISADAAEPDINCDGGADLNVDHTETLDFTAPADGLYYIVVDSYYTDEGGAFTLELAF